MPSTPVPEVRDHDLPVVESTFWRTSYWLVLIHSTCIWISCFVCVFPLLGAKTDPDDSTTLLVLFAVIFFLSITSILASVGFYKCRRSDRSKGYLIAYIILQSLYFVSSLTCVSYVFYVILALAAGYQNQSTVGLAVVIILALVGSCLPLWLVIGRGVWILFHRPQATG